MNRISLEAITLHGLGITRSKILKSLNQWNELSYWWKAKPQEIMQLGITQDRALELVKLLKSLDSVRYFHSLLQQNIQTITEFDTNYPHRLFEIKARPLILYIKGNLETLAHPSIAVVGTRKPSPYGKEITENFVRDLVTHDLTIISGLAYGVDTIAHQTTVHLKGKTIAVLGSGIDQIHPRVNQKLAEEILETNGTILSEYPPGTPPLRQHFPARNRIIAGLSLATLLTEGAIDSGSLITAKFSQEFKRPVFAVPGPITQSMSSGPNNLIQLGSKVALSSKDIIGDFLKIESLTTKTSPNFQLSTLEKTTLDLLKKQPLSFDQIKFELQCSSKELLNSITSLELEGLISINQGIIYAT